MLTQLGLAVVPTWLVIRDHEPIEHGSTDEPQTKGRDEEESSVNNTEKTDYVVKEAPVA